jgi:hypothetical protein
VTLRFRGTDRLRWQQGYQIIPSCNIPKKNIQNRSIYQMAAEYSK